jgi:hypothetical protein
VRDCSIGAVAKETVTVRWISVDGTLNELDVLRDAITPDGHIQPGYYGSPRRYSPGDGIARLEAQAENLRLQLEEFGS